MVRRPLCTPCSSSVTVYIIGVRINAHLCDVQVYDIAFSRAGGGRDMFASVGADGSVRMFDLRHLEHSTIIYEDPQHHPLLRLCWNKQDPNYLATMAMDGMEVTSGIILYRVV